MTRCRLLTLALVWFLALAGAGSGRSAESPDERPVVIVGIVYDGPPPDQEVVSLQRFMEVPGRIREETEGLLRRDFDVRFPPDKRVMGGWNATEIRAAIDRMLADPEVDVLITLGVFGSTMVSRRDDLPKPVIAPFAIDATAQSLPLADNTSGVRNLNYLMRRGNVLLDLQTFKDKLVAFERLHVLVDAMFFEMIPELRDYVVRLDRQVGTLTTIVPVVRSADDALDALDGAEAVYVTPLMRLPAREFDRLVDGLVERGLPSFSLQGEVEVRRGVMAGVRRATDLGHLARRVALNIQRILLGEDAGTLPVTLDQPERLLINMNTAEAVGVYPRWRVTLEADLIGEAWPWGRKPNVDDSLTLSAAVHEAVASNLGLRATDRGVAAGAENVRLARSLFRPRIDSAASGIQIDEDRGSVLQPERTGTASVSASQILYSDGVRSELEVSRSLQSSLEWERETERLDVALEAAVAFLDVLRAQTLERVAQENLRLTESNLELARKRESIGFSGPADVLRWESELATDRSEVIATNSIVHRSFLVLNRVLHRPLEQIYETPPPALEDPHLVTGTGRLGPYVDNAIGFELFREFSVREGLSNAPELVALDATIEAAARTRLAAQRSYWAPEVVLFGDVSREFSRDGSGSENTGIPLAFGSDRDGWSLGLTATLPLFTGGSRKAQVRQSSEVLAESRLRRDVLAERIETRIRNALHAIASTFPSIELAHEAAAAASKNLELVTDSYSRGAVSIIDLLDAQNAALVAGEFTANAVYDFLLDLMELQRSTSDFDFFRSDAGRETWFGRVEAYFDEAGYSPRGR